MHIYMVEQWRWDALFDLGYLFFLWFLSRGLMDFCFAVQQGFPLGLGNSM